MNTDSIRRRLEDARSSVLLLAAAGLSPAYDKVFDALAYRLARAARQLLEVRP